MQKIQLYILHILGLLGVYIAPVKDVMIAVSFLVVLDFITGIAASIKSKKPITSKGFRQTVTKTLAYQATLIVSLILENHLLQGIPVIKVVSSLIAVTETKSFFENIEILTGVNFWEKLVSKLTHLIKKD